MIRNSKGFSLLETMIAVGLVGIVGLGLASLLVEMGKQQNSANVKAILLSQKLKIESLIKDSKSWSATVADGSNDGKAYIECMRVPPVPAGGCTPITDDANGFMLTEASGVDYYDFSVATAGFSGRGSPCNSWPSDACPIRWRTLMTMTCQGTPPCLTPTVRVIARPEIPIAQATAMGMASINFRNYEVDVTRGIGTRFDPILIVERIAGSSAGPCTGGEVTRQLNFVANDPAGNITRASSPAPGVLPTAGQAEFVPGSYQCRITAPAFKVGNHTIRWETTAGVVVGASSASNSPRRFTVGSNAVLEVSFVISANTTFRIRHACEFSTLPAPTYPGEADTTNVFLGYTTPTNYAAPDGTTYTTVACYRNG